MLEGSMVEKLPIGLFIGWFIFYLITHIIIGLLLNKFKNEFEKGDLSKEETVKLFTFLFKWYPAFLLVIILLSFLVNK